MINLNIPNFTKDEYIAYWVKLNTVILKSSGLIILKAGYEPICAKLNISLNKCKAFIKEAQKLGVISVAKTEVDGKVSSLKFTITDKYIIRNIEEEDYGY
jgi:hypothetical protein